MTDHLRVYVTALHIAAEDVVCEITGRPAHMGNVDISHNKGRGMGGSKKRNTIENLMALDRRFHTYLENNPGMYWWYTLVHMGFLYHQTPYIAIAKDDPILAKIMEDIAKGKQGL